MSRRSTPPLSAENLLSRGGTPVVQYSRTISWYSVTALSMSRKTTPSLFHSSCQAMVDDFGVVLRADAREELALGLGDAQAVKGALDTLWHLVPGTLPCCAAGLR